MHGHTVALVIFIVLVLLLALVLVARVHARASPVAGGGGAREPRGPGLLLASGVVALHGGRAGGGRLGGPKGAPGARLAAAISTPPRDLRRLDEDGVARMAQQELKLLQERPDTSMVIKVHPGDSATYSVVLRAGLFDFLSDAELEAMETPATLDRIPVLLCTADSARLTSWLVVWAHPSAETGRKMVAVPGGFP